MISDFLLHDISQDIRYTNLIKEILKLDKKNELSFTEKEFLVSTLEDTYDLDEKQIERIFADKMIIILKARDEGHKPIALDELLSLCNDKKYPDLDKLFCVCKGKSNKIYSYMVDGYINAVYAVFGNEDDRKDLIKNYNNKTEIFNNLSKNILENIEVNSFPEMKRIVNIPNFMLNDIISYDCEEKSIAELLNYIIISQTFSKRLMEIGIMETNFLYALNFILKDDLVSIRASLAEKILMQGKTYNTNLNRIIDMFPPYLIEHLDSYEDPINDDVTKDFISDISKLCIQTNGYGEYIENLNSMPEEYQDITTRLVTNKRFLELDLPRRNSILKNIIDSKDHFAPIIISEFLFNTNKNGVNGFLENIDDVYLESTCAFLSDDADLLDAKFRVLNRIKSQVEDDSLPGYIYTGYLESLDTAIKDMKTKDKIKYLDAHSKFFEKNSLKEFAKKFDDVSLSFEYKRKLKEALGENRKYNQLKYIFKFATIADNQYVISMAEKIIDQLMNAQTKENVKTIFDVVTSDYFKKADNEKKENILTDLPGRLEEIDSGNLSIQIPDHGAIDSELSKQKQMVFTNKETGIRLNITQSKK